jgi:hypothetical protein
MIFNMQNNIWKLFLNTDIFIKTKLILGFWFGNYMARSIGRTNVRKGKYKNTRILYIYIQNSFFHFGNQILKQILEEGSRHLYFSTLLAHFPLGKWAYVFLLLLGIFDFQNGQGELRENKFISPKEHIIK